MLRLLLILLLFGLGPFPAAGKQIGEENREYLNDKAKAIFAGVGRAVCIHPSGEEFFSTVTLVVNQKTVLGSGHYRTMEGVVKGPSVDGKRCRVEFHDGDGGLVFSSRVASEVLAEPADAYVEVSTFRHDWGVLTLVTPAPTFIRPLKVTQKALSDLAGTEVFIVGYHNDPRVAPSVKIISLDCRPAPLPSRAFVSFKHVCDTSKGSSGSLMYIEMGGEPVAVAINHAESTNSNQSNFGQLISDALLNELEKRKAHRD